MSKAAMITLDEIRKQYPEPMMAWARYTDSYCVGGSLCLSLGKDMRWPDYESLSGVLKELGCSKAILRAKAIIKANDDGDFDKAWQILGEALDSIPRTKREGR